MLQDQDIVKAPDCYGSKEVLNPGHAAENDCESCGLRPRCVVLARRGHEMKPCEEARAIMNYHGTKNILSAEDRIDLYHAAFPDRPPLYVFNDRIEGLWEMGANYRTQGGYGAYPAGYLDRVMSMFPCVAPSRILHLFSGWLSAPAGAVTLDINPDRGPTVVGDAHELSSHFDANSFSLILADPPYSAEDAEHYGTCMINRRKVMSECWQVLAPGGWLVWLDQVKPMYRKSDWRYAMAIGMVKSTNHRVRAVFGFEKI